MSKKIVNLMMGLFVLLAFSLTGCGGGDSGGETVTNPYAGTYSGKVTFLGLSDSTWSATVDTAGNVKGTFTSMSGWIESKYNLTGSVSTIGDINMKVDGASTNNFTGKVSTTGAVSGTYTPASGISGSFDGQRKEGAITTTTNNSQATISTLKGTWIGTAKYNTWYYNYCNLTIDDNNNVSGKITYTRHAPAAFSYSGTCSVSGTITASGNTYSGYLKSSSCTGDDKDGFDITMYNVTNKQADVTFLYGSGSNMDLVGTLTR